MNEAATPHVPSPGDQPPSDPVLVWIERGVRLIALSAGGLALFALVTITVVDVTLRYVFLSPLTGARDLSGLALLSVVALSVAYSGRTGGQVAVELFLNMVGSKVQRIVDPLIRFAGVAMLAILVWQLWHAGTIAALVGGASPELRIPYGPFYGLLAFGIALYALVLMAEIAAALRGRDHRANLEI